MFSDDCVVIVVVKNEQGTKLIYREPVRKSGKNSISAGTMFNDMMVEKVCKN